MTFKIPEQPENSFRVTLELETAEPRLDVVLLEALKKQTENETFSAISKKALKDLFIEKKVLIKGQSAKPKSRINNGVTYIDILL
jgi:23S rRNA-/tRNA-specific pseudouridylate synthase